VKLYEATEYDNIVNTNCNIKLINEIVSNLNEMLSAIAFLPKIS
jgi:hypothetical protein